MELNYKYVESTIKPVALEVHEGTVYLRKEITSIKRTSEQVGDIVYWTYKEAALTQKEFNDYISIIMAENAIKGTNDSDNIMKIIVGQENGDSNQLIIMEAIADLYDTIVMMSKSLQGGQI